MLGKRWAYLWGRGFIGREIPYQISIMCTEARAVTSGMIKIPSTSVAEFIQLLQPIDQMSCAPIEVVAHGNRGEMSLKD